MLEVSQLNGFSTGRSIVSAGLVLELDAGNTGSYPGTGTTWTDLSGNGNNGTLVNGPTYSSASGGSLVLNGTNQYITLSNIQSYLVNTSKFTYSTFIKITSAKITGMFFSFGNSYVFNNDITFYYYPTDGTLRFQVNNGADGEGYFSHTIGSWENISVIYDGTQSTNATRLKVYLNGVEKTITFGTYTVPSTTSNVNFTSSGIGSYSTNGYNSTNFMGGSISQVSLYNRALSAAEIEQNFYALRGRFGI